LPKIDWTTVVAVLVILVVLGMVAPRLRTKITG
jgi:hypothetical protein